MGKLILYGTEMSPPTRAVRVVLNVLNIDYEFKELNFQVAEHKSEAYLKKNPQHTVPLIEDDGKIIWDSHVIAAYLVSKYGKDDSLYPKDFYQRALVDQRLHFDSGVLYPRLGAVLRGVVFDSNPEIPPEKLASAYEALDFLEKFLQSDGYVAGNSLTLADFFCCITVSISHQLIPLDASKYPKIVAWYKKISNLPYFKAVNEKGSKKLTELVRTKMESLKMK